VRTHLMDVQQRAVSLDAAGHRPGYVMLSDAEREPRAALYRDHDERLSARWKNATLRR
jgi:hypothetical protein